MLPLDALTSGELAVDRVLGITARASTGREEAVDDRAENAEGDEQERGGGAATRTAEERAGQGDERDRDRRVQEVQSFGRPGRPGLIRVINRWHLEHAGGTKVVLAIVVLALGFAILLTV